MHDWSTAEAAYLAGLLDGEGSFMVLRRRDSPRLMLCVAVGMVHRPTVEWVAERFGGVAVTQARRRLQAAHHQTPWRTQVCGVKAKEVAQRVRPFLVTKRDHADLFLSFPMTPPKGRAKRVAEEEVAERDRIAHAIQALNVRGAGQGAHNAIRD